MSLPLPDGVLGMADRSEEWAAWVDRLPGTVDDLCQEWTVRPDGLAMHGFCALVVPVAPEDRAAGDDGEAVLKVSFPDDDTAHEHLALRAWAGRGAVRLLRADTRRRALLLERLGTRKLDDVTVDEACEVVAGLYSRLHVEAGEQYPALSDWAARWEERLSALDADAPVPRRLVAHARSLARDLAVDPLTDGILLHGDLHYLNVLAADREPWLAIDPKPMSGDPCLEPAPMLWNRWDEALADGDARGAVRRRLESSSTSLSWTRTAAVPGWSFGWWRSPWSSGTSADGPRGARIATTVATRELITASVTVAKAIQPD